MYSILKQYLGLCNARRSYSIMSKYLNLISCTVPTIFNLGPVYMEVGSPMYSLIWSNTTVFRHVRLTKSIYFVFLTSMRMRRNFASFSPSLTICYRNYIIRSVLVQSQSFVLCLCFLICKLLILFIFWCRLKYSPG